MRPTPNRARQHDTPPAARGGMTLVELLVVIVLITTLVSTAIPIISPGGDARRLREASRSVNAYVQGAQTRAVQTGRPFGVALRRLSADTGRAEDNAACLRLEYVEVPPAFSGFATGSGVRVGLNPNYQPSADNNIVGDDDVGPVWLQFVAPATLGVTGAGLPAGYQADLIPPWFLRPGDVVEALGHRYVLLEGTGVATGSLATTNGYFEFPSNTPVRLAAKPEGFATQDAPWRLPQIPAAYDNNGAELGSPEVLANNPTAYQPPYWTAPAPYRVFRLPVPAAGEPYELPGGMAIDLQASALVENGGVLQLYDPASDLVADAARDDSVMLLFAPEGRVHRLHGVAAEPLVVTGTVAMCVGRRELIPARPYTEEPDAATEAEYRNPLDMTSTANSGSYVAYGNLSETEQLEVANNYNWLNLDSRWVVVGGQTGSVATLEGVAVYGEPTTTGQIAATLENLAGRQPEGGN